MRPRTKRASPTAVKTARLLARRVAAEPKPFLVLADNNGTVPERTRNAGRITAEMGLSPAEWKVFAGGRKQNCASGSAKKRACDRVSPSLRRLRRNSGRDRAFSGADRSPRRSAWFSTPGHLRIWRGRVRCDRRAGAISGAHLVYPFERLPPGCSPPVSQRSNGTISKRCGTEFSANWAKAAWIFRRCCAGSRSADTTATCWWSRMCCPGMGAPKESARRNREYLRSIEQCLHDCVKGVLLAEKN